MTYSKFIMDTLKQPIQMHRRNDFKNQVSLPYNIELRRWIKGPYQNGRQKVKF